MNVHALKTPSFENNVVKLRKKRNWSEVVPVAILLLVFVVFSFASEAFLTERNLTNLSRQVSVNCILAFGMTIIILLAGIDLSVGSLVALGTVIAAITQVNMGLNEMGILGALMSLGIALSVCGLVGAFSGALVSKLKMPSFVVTLGVLVMARGLALILSGGSKISPLSADYRWIGADFLNPLSSAILLGIFGIVGSLFFYKTKAKRSWFSITVLWACLISAAWIFCNYRGIPIPVIVTLVCFGSVYYLLNETSFGRYVYAIGGNPEAARLCGINVSRVVFWSFVLMGVFVGLASTIEGSRIDAGDPTSGQLYELDAIAAVVIGGTSLQGGIGKVQGTLIGAILIGSMNNGMSLLNIPTHYQMVIKGLIIILAVLMDVTSKKKTAS